MREGPVELRDSSGTAQELGDSVHSGRAGTYRPRSIGGLLMRSMSTVGRGSRRPPLHMGVMVALLLSLSACGQERASNLVAPQPGSATGQSEIRIAPFSDDTIPDQLIMQLMPGADSGFLTTEYGLELIEHDSGNRLCQCLVSVEGLSDQLIQDLFADTRIEVVGYNYHTDTAESRQRSWAFDDGDPSPDSYFDQQAVDRLGLVQAHHVSTGDGVVVAVLDTGVDIDHPELASHLVAGYDFVEMDADPSDAPDGLDNDGDTFTDEATGHGTHVAGIVALTAPGAKILPIRVLDSDGRGDAFTVTRGIYYAIAQGAQVINLSLGMINESDVVDDALQDAVNAGIVVVSSMGNWGAEHPEEFPAKDKFTRGVAAIDGSDRAAPFTSFGSHTDLSAPGVSIRSTYWNGGYAIWSGTSMAAPFVAGGAALLISIHPEWSSDQVWGRLASTSRSLGVANPTLAQKLGAGALDLGAALAADNPGGDGTDDTPIRLGSAGQ